jgi:RNA polymerase sigma-70 factor (ECF subfamily)
MTTLEERHLLDRCIRGEAQAWEEFVHRYGGIIRAAVDAALKRSRGRADRFDVEDVFQAILTSLWDDKRRRLASFRRTSSLASWLSVIAARTALNHARTESRKEGRRFADLIRPRHTPPEDLGEYIRRLKPRQRAVLSLRFYEGMKPSEIAELLGMNKNSVSCLISRAARELARSVASPATDGRLAVS